MRFFCFQFLHPISFTQPLAPITSKLKILLGFFCFHFPRISFPVYYLCQMGTSIPLAVLTRKSWATTLNTVNKGTRICRFPERIFHFQCLACWQNFKLPRSASLENPIGATCLANSTIDKHLIAYRARYRFSYVDDLPLLSIEYSPYRGIYLIKVVVWGNISTENDIYASLIDRWILVLVPFVKSVTTWPRYCDL